MTNKATVSQPKVVAAKPSEPVIQAMKAILFSGRIVDTFMIYDLYNAAHRVERSQPKSTPQEKIPQESIGDDAQFNILADAMCWNYVENYVNGGSAEKAQQAQNARRNLIEYVDSCTPSAQASATIQAAPEIRLVVSTDVKGDAIIVEVNARQGDKMTPLYSRKHCLNGTVIGTAIVPTSIFAAAIQAAPKGYAIQAGDNELLEVASTVLAKYGYALASRHIAELHTRITLAAPMVADPAGVAVEQWHQSKYKMLEDYIAKLETNLAATVKAIPSEALEAAVKACEQVQARVIESNGGEAHYDDWSTMDEGIYAGAGYCIGKINALQIAAPLADKTGGGE